MQDKSEIKFEFFDELPPELKVEVAQNLSNRDLVNLAQTSKYHLSLFKPMVDVRKLLHHVVRGQHDAVQSKLTDDISLMLKKGFVTDCSGREFENISGFEYALWALDKHMWAKMITCVPQNEEGKRIFEILIAQYNKVNTDGVTYRLNGKTITEKHFDFENTIIKELQKQVDLINAPGEKNWSTIDNQWREGVGGAQKRLPMHIVYEYCSDTPFCPIPRFISQPKSLKKFWNSNAYRNEDWFSVDSELGTEFAIYKGMRLGHWAVLVTGNGRCGRGRMPGRPASRDDLKAMIALCKVRTNDFIDLKTQLEDQMMLDNHHQVSQI